LFADDISDSATAALFADLTGQLLFGIPFTDLRAKFD